MLKFTSIVGYTSCGPTYIKSVLTIFGQCINVLNYKYIYIYILKNRKKNTFIHTSLFRDCSLLRGFIYIYIYIYIYAALGCSGNVVEQNFPSMLELRVRAVFF